jgi:hypothetical protein
MIKGRPGFRVHPRGFMGGVPELRMEKTPPSITLFSAPSPGHVTITQPGDSELCVNLQVEALYGNYLRRSGEVTGVPFRNNVLGVALSAFGTKSFYRWFVEQRVSPGMGDLQYRFLIDTLQFLQGGRRSLDMTTWETLVMVKQSVPVPKTYVEACEKFFGVRPTEYKAKSNESLVDVLQHWCSRPNGIEDLLQSLHLLFGNP